VEPKRTSQVPGTILTFLLLIAATGSARAVGPTAEMELSLGMGGLKSSLLDVYRSRERFPGTGEVVGIENAGPITIYEPALLYQLSWKSWKARFRLSGEVYDSPPNDRSNQGAVWHPDTALFSAQTGTLSNMAAYQGEAAIGYEFRSKEGWNFTPFLGSRFRQEDFGYESFSLPAGPGVFAFRSYERKWISFHMWILFAYNVGPFEIQIEPGWSLWTPGYLRGSGTSFDFAFESGLTALYEEFRVDTLADVRSLELRIVFPITDVSSDSSAQPRPAPPSDPGSGSLRPHSTRTQKGNASVFLSLKVEGIHFLARDLNGFYFGSPEAGYRALLRDASVLESDRHDLRFMLTFGMRFSTSE